LRSSLALTSPLAASGEDGGEGFQSKRVVCKELSPPLSLANGEATHIPAYPDRLEDAEPDSAAFHEPLVRNLFARQSRFHLIKLPKTIALHAYATNI
jgi:hypothetical protein